MLKEDILCCTAVILVGGQASRFGRLGQLIPKGLLPVSEYQTILSRIMDQLIEAQIDQIIISASRENFDFFKCFVKNYIEIGIPVSNSKVELLLNEKHIYGPLAALGYALSTVNSDSYLLCLGDIFYSANPFIQLVFDIKAGVIRNYLLAYPVSDNESLKEGGILCTNGELLAEIYKFFFNFLNKHNAYASYKKYLWSGSALFDASVKNDLHDLVCLSQETILENLFSFSIARERKFYVRAVEKFVNVNSYSDFLINFKPTSLET